MVGRNIYFLFHVVKFKRTFCFTLILTVLNIKFSKAAITPTTNLGSLNTDLSEIPSPEMSFLFWPNPETPESPVFRALPRVVNNFEKSQH